MKTILLIEDSKEIRENTAEILELANYKVLTAAHGKFGVDIATKERPDLIICDIMMPELDGYGVLYLLSKNASTANIPFIFLTAKTEKSDLRKGMNMGADDYITKPFEEMDLLSAIESRLTKHELFNKEFNRNMEGLNEFFAKAKGIEELKQLSVNQKLRSFKKRDLIYMEGDDIFGIAFIAKGKVKTFKTNEEGKELVTNMHSEGDFIGYNDLIENQEYRESAEALEDSEVCFIPKEDFYSLIFTNRDVAATFIKLLSHNLAETESRLLKLAYNSVRKRVADALISFHERSAKAGTLSGNIMVTREDLASMAGTATESVIRALSDFKDEKLIDIQGKEIKILNSDKLIRMKN